MSCPHAAIDPSCFTGGGQACCNSSIAPISHAFADVLGSAFRQTAMLLFTVNVVLAVLLVCLSAWYARRFINARLVTENALRRLTDDGVALSIEPELVRPDAIAAKLTADAVHQGLLAEADPLPSPDLEVKLDDDGELCIRGPLLMTGYLEREDEEGCFTPDGFFRTGDLAQWEPDGMLRIVGRKKHLFVLSTGKKLSPEQQAIFREESAAAGDLMRKLIGDGEAEQIKKLEAAGMQVTRPDLAPFRAKMEPAYKRIADYAAD